MEAIDLLGKLFHANFPNSKDRVLLNPEDYAPNQIWDKIIMVMNFKSSVKYFPKRNMDQILESTLISHDTHNIKA